MSTANIRETRVALAFRHQADIATLPAAANFFSLSKTNAALAVVDPKTEDDAADIGKGDEFPNNVFPVNQDASAPYEKFASSERSCVSADVSGSRITGWLTTMTS